MREHLILISFRYIKNLLDIKFNYLLDFFLLIKDLINTKIKIF